MIRFGRAKQYADVKLEDHLKHLVWTSAHGGRHDEESEKPIVSANEVTQEIVNHDLVVPIITVKVEGAETFGIAWYLHNDGVIFAISLWRENRWVSPANVFSLPLPTFFVAVPKILGVPNVRFRRNAPSEERAERVN